MPLTYKELKTKLRRSIWVAPGEPANLVAAHNIFFNEAMIELAKWCQLLRQNNTSIIPACSTLVRCGLTVLDLPTTVEGPGVLKRVYTIANDEWCFPAGTMVETESGQRAIETILAGEKVQTRNGLKRVTWSGQTAANARLMRVSLEDGSTLDATPKHRVWTNEGWICLEDLSVRHTLLRWHLKQSCSKALPTGVIQTPRRVHTRGEGIFTRLPFREIAGYCTGKFGSLILGQSQKAMSFITEMVTLSTMPLRTCSVSGQPTTSDFITQNTSGQKKSALGVGKNFWPFERTRRFVQALARQVFGSSQESITSLGNVKAAENSSRSTNTSRSDFVAVRVLTVTPLLRAVSVFDLAVEDEHEFLANGFVVHNCDYVFYEKTEFSKVQCWSRDLLCGFTAPANAGLPALQQGFKYASSESDSTYGRGRIGMWATDRKRLYIAPWLQSNEKLVIEWDGWKAEWKDDDLVDEVLWSADVQAAIRTYVRWKHEDLFGCDLQKKRDLQVQFYGNGGDIDGELADLMYWDKKKREGEPEKDCDNRYVPTSAETEDDEVPATPSSEVIFAIIGDYGDTTTPAEQVADMVKSWNPEFIATAGDNWYGNPITKADLDLKVGRLYHEFIGDYSGIYGAGATRQNFYPSLGDHDRDPVGRLDVFLDYFNFAKLQDIAGGTEIRPFYSVVRGPLHIFVLDQGYDQDDVNQQTAYGNTATSAQAEWLRVSLLLSTARWKMVILGAAPYSSFPSGTTNAPFTDGFKAYPALRWPFKQWGADVVVSGDLHWYERLEVDGLPYITNGSGGKSLFTSNEAPSEYSQFIYSGDYGAQKCIVNCNTLQMDFYSRLGDLKESFVLEKE